MKTLKLNVFDLKLDSENIDRACEILKSGGLVAIPTETVYGLAASAYDEKAVRDIFAAKGRPQDNPLIVHIGDIEMLEELVSDIPEEALICAKKFWPGPFTMVLKRSEKIPASVSAGLDTVAVRMPSNEVAAEIIRRSRLPLAAPSANLSGSPSPTTAEHVIADLDGKIDVVVVSNACAVGVESTVITLATEIPMLLRPGGVTLEQLKDVLGDVAVADEVLNPMKKDEKAESPGMKYKHYSPDSKCKLLIFTFEYSI